MELFIIILPNISFSIGLYLIAKKLGETKPYLAFIPILNFYTLVKLAGKSGWWVLWFLLSSFFIIPWLILLAIICHSISKRTGGGIFRTILLLLFPYITFLVLGIKLKKTDIKII